MNGQNKTRAELSKEISGSRQTGQEPEPAESDPTEAGEALREREERPCMKPLNILSPDDRVEEVELRNIIDSEAIQSLMETFYSLTQIGVAILDIKGNILVATGWQDICTRFHRVHPETSANCTESDLALSQGVPPGEIRGYKCKNNLWDFVTPIFIADQHMGNLYLGQFIFEDEVLDHDLFDHQAVRYGFDKAKYRAALDHVPRWSRERVNTVMKFYRHLVDMISQSSFSHLKLAHELAERKQAEKALQKSETRFREMFDDAPIGYHELDTEARITSVNRTELAMLGYAAEEMLSHHSWEFVAEKELSRKAVLDKLTGILPPGRNVERTFRKKDGTRIRVLIQDLLLRDIHGNISGIRTTVQDITERKQAEEALLKSEARYRTLVENASDMVYRADENGYLTFVNPATLRITGYTEEEVLGKHFKMLVRPDMFKETITFFADQLIHKIGNTYYEYPIVTKDGRELWIGQNMQLIMEEDRVTGFQAVARDISERRQAGEELKESESRYRELSTVDDLTQLYNARYFYRQLKMELERSDRYKQPLTLLLLDLDDFKRFNDAYGHVEGDQVLCRLGRVVKRCLREADSAYRYGGEEFTILLPMTTSADGAITAERIRTEFRKELFSPAPGQDVHVTVSIGLGQYREREEMKVFVHRVDQLMYQGKKSGKDRVCSDG